MPDSAWTKVASALLRAEEAVRLDGAGDYKAALVCYKDAIMHLDSEVLGAVGDEERERLIEIVTMYTSRVEAILGAIPALAAPAPAPSLVAFDFQETQPLGSVPDQPPSSVVYRPYWLMRMLGQTMTRGGYMTQRLYVPRNVWFQAGAKFTAIETKFSSCETILIYLQKLKDEDISDTQKISKELDEFCTQLDNVQNALARKLKFINEIKNEKSADTMSTLLSRVGNNISKSVERLQANVMRLRIEDDTAYIELLIKIFELAQYMEQWQSHFEAVSNALITSKLRRISDFFYQVLCAFVIRDFNMLLERYLKKTRQAYVSPV